MSGFGGISRQRARLGAELRRLRDRIDLSGEELANRAGMSQSKVSRIELGQSPPSTSDLERWLSATEATSDEREALTQLLEAVRSEIVVWRRAPQGGLPDLHRDAATLDASSGIIRSFHPLLVPGLLQTAEYARQILTAFHPAGRPDLAAGVAARLERQAVLYDPSKRIEVIVGEPALRWRYGQPEAMVAQLGHLASLATLSNVLVGLLPLDRALPVWHSHGFDLFDERGEEEAMVLVETLDSGREVSDPEDVERYRQAFARLREVAIVGEEAQAFVNRLMGEQRPSPG